MRESGRTQVLCAGVAIALAAACAGPRPTAVSPAAGPLDDKACEQLSDVADSRPVARHMVAGVLLVPLAVVSALTIPFGGRGVRGIALPGQMFDKGSQSAKENNEARSRFLAACVELVTAERNYGPNDHRIAPSLIKLGDSYYEARAFSQASDLYRRALNVQAVRAEGDELANLLEKHMEALRKLDRWQEASQIYERLRKIRPHTDSRPTPGVAGVGTAETVNCMVAGERKWAAREECD